MINEASIAISPKLPLREVDDNVPGLRVFEIVLNSSGTSVAPFKSARFTVDPGCITPVDSHSMREIWVVAAGSGELLYDDQRVPMHTWDVVYLEPPKEHQVLNNGTDQLVVISVWWDAPQ
ncbi:MAG TPA: cupin domain-containing protein [Pyrinomonadaceae bacterium]